MMNNFLTGFELLCERIFDFSIKTYLLSIKKSESFNGVLYSVSFGNKVVGVECNYDIREGVSVVVVQMKSIEKDVMAKNGFLVETLLRINKSTFKIDTTQLERARKDNVYDLLGIESVLMQYATVLKMYGQKVLVGDFSELKEEIKEIEERKKINDVKVIYLADSNKEEKDKGAA